MIGEPGKEGGATVGDEHEMAERDREWLDRMADAEDRCVGGPSVGGLAVDLGMLASPSDGIWRCENCGGIVEATDSRARWAGDRWQHACGDPQAGHYDCRFFGEVDQRDAEIARLAAERDAAIKHKDEVIERTLDTLMKGCKAHGDVSFPAWLDAGGDECSLCQAAEIARLRHEPKAQREGMGREIGRLAEAESTLRTIRAAIIDQNFITPGFYAFHDTSDVYADEPAAWEGFLDYCRRHCGSAPGPDGEGSDTD